MVIFNNQSILPAVVQQDIIIGGLLEVVVAVEVIVPIFKIHLRLPALYTPHSTMLPLLLLLVS